VGGGWAVLRFPFLTTVPARNVQYLHNSSDFLLLTRTSNGSLTFKCLQEGAKFTHAMVQATRAPWQQQGGDGEWVYAGQDVYAVLAQFQGQHAGGGRASLKK
jgi:hypothetical protein